MSKQEENKENEPNIEQELSYVIYTKAVSMVQMIDARYEEEMAESFDYAMFGVLMECYPYKEPYERLLTYMQEHGIYMRYIKPILEIQYNSIDPKEVKQSNNTNVENTNKSNKDENSGNGRVSTETDKSKIINKDFINRLFLDED